MLEKIFERIVGKKAHIESASDTEIKITVDGESYRILPKSPHDIYLYLENQVGTCKSCGEPIRFDAVDGFWKHSTSSPRHPAILKC